ncbi:MAG TPA: RNHCP domain-containing protein, partial [Patescibacteria group bacterium]|nr:RNHCP domain-containing protein [Patescibacteria group bacterium]
SKHVDVYPGDRQATCGGLMKPIYVEQKGDQYQLTHRCIQCGYTKNNKTSGDDNFEALLALVKQ